MNQRVIALTAALAVAAVLLAAASGLAAPASGLAAPASGLAAPADSGTADAAASTPPATVADADYRIAEEDVLRMDVWGEPQLSNMQIPVPPGGKISVPYLGDMQAAGLTQAELAQQISKKLADAEIVYDARVQISVYVLHQPQVYVFGAVQRPSSFPFKTGATVLDAIALAGSYSDDAMLEAASITHKDSDQSVPLNLKKLFENDLTQNYELQNGDKIYIPHEDYNNKIFVLGQVNRPGVYSLKDNTTVLSAISLASGQTPDGSVRNTVVVRGDPSHPIRESSAI